MTQAKKKINTFIYLLENRVSLFSEQFLTDFKQQVSQQSNDVEQLSETIENWFKNHDNLYKIYQGQLNRDLMAGDEPPPEPDENEDYQKRLQNAIHNAMVVSSSSPSQSLSP
ncbi:hypothetical protein NUACC21_49710 [Scytonema sp. NUACC21]